MGERVVIFVGGVAGGFGGRLRLDFLPLDTNVRVDVWRSRRGCRGGGTHGGQLGK